MSDTSSYKPSTTSTRRPGKYRNRGTGLAGRLTDTIGGAFVDGASNGMFSAVVDAGTVDPAATGFEMPSMDTLSQWGGLASGLAETYMGLKQLGLAEDAFKFNKDMKNKEYAMAKDAYDRNKARADNISAQMNAGKVGA